MLISDFIAALMTRIEFFFNVPDKLAKVADICAKDAIKGHQLTIFSENEAMNSSLQALIWQYSATSFLPNNLAQEFNSQFSPIVLDTCGEKLIQDDILINLQGKTPPFFSRFRVLIEIVGIDEADKSTARARFRFYRDRGYEIKSSDMATLNN